LPRRRKRCFTASPVVSLLPTDTGRQLVAYGDWRMKRCFTASSAVAHGDWKLRGASIYLDSEQ
jgi:hypothetical protein